MRRAGIHMAITWTLVGGGWVVGVALCAARFWWLSVLFAWFAVANLAIAASYLWAPVHTLPRQPHTVHTGAGGEVAIERP